MELLVAVAAAEGVVCSALRSAYYALAPGDRAAWGLPGSCPPTSWTPISCCQLVNFAGLSHSGLARMVAAGGDINEQRRPPVRWATCSSAGFFSGDIGEPSCGASAAGRGTNINTKARQQTRGTSPCDPRTGLRDAALRMPRSGLGCHYFRCLMQALPSSAQGPLKPVEQSGASDALLFCAASSLSCWKLTNNQRSCGRRPVNRNQYARARPCWS